MTTTNKTEPEPKFAEGDFVKLTKYISRRKSKHETRFYGAGQLGQVVCVYPIRYPLVPGISIEYTDNGERMYFIGVYGYAPSPTFIDRIPVSESQIELAYSFYADVFDFGPERESDGFDEEFDFEGFEKMVKEKEALPPSPLPGKIGKKGLEDPASPLPGKIGKEGLEDPASLMLGKIGDDFFF